MANTPVGEDHSLQYGAESLSGALGLRLHCWDFFFLGPLWGTRAHETENHGHVTGKYEDKNFCI